MKRMRAILCLSFLFLTCVFCSHSSAQWNGGTTPNLSLPLSSYNISLFELLTHDLQGIDSLFGETTLTYSATMTAWSSASINDVTLAGNPTINFPSTPLAGEHFLPLGYPACDWWPLHGELGEFDKLGERQCSNAYEYLLDEESESLAVHKLNAWLAL